MREQTEFDMLTAEDQRSATEIGVALTILATRIPGMDDRVVEGIAAEFSRSTKLSKNRIKYVMEQVGRALYERQWRFEVVKTGPSLKTTFESKDGGENGNGDHESVQESAPLN